MLKVWNFTVAFFAFLLLLVYSFSLSVPWFSHWLYDYSKPTNVHWEIVKEEKKDVEKTQAEVKSAEAVQFEDHSTIKDSENKNFEFVGPELPVAQNQEKDTKEKIGEEPKKEDPPIKNAVFTYDNHWSGALERFYERFPLPIQPTWWMLLPIGLLAGIIFFLLISRVNKYSDFLFIVFIILQILCYATVAGASLWNAYHFDVRAIIRSNIMDADLAAAILRSYAFDQLFIGFFFPLLVTIIMNIALTGLAFFTSSGCKKLNEFYSKVIDKRLSGFDDSNILIRHDGGAELFTLGYGFRWLFFPVFFMHNKMVRSRVSASEFIGAFISRLLSSAIMKFRENFLAEYIVQYQDMGKKAVRRLLTGISIEFQTSLGTCMEKVKAKKDRETNIPTAHSILKEGANRCVSQFRQGMVAGIKDAVYAYYRDEEGFSDSLRKKIFDSGKSDPEIEDAVLPQGTRFFSSNGRYSFFVIEQPPQLRTINFTNTFFMETLGISEESWIQFKSEHVKTNSIQLSFPFVIFVIVVGEGNEFLLNVYYRNEPLRSMNDPIFKSNFPNVQKNGSACLNFSRSNKRSNTMAEKVNDLVAYFWDSWFNRDYLEQNYKPASKLDPRLKSIWHWEEESRKDPLFVLRIPWIAHDNRLKNMAQKYLEDTNHATARTFECAVKEIIGRKQSDIGKIVKEFCTQIALPDFDEATAKLLSENMHGELLEITTMLATSVEDACERLNAGDYERFSRHIRDLAREIIDKHTSTLHADCSGKGEVPLNIDEILTRIFCNRRF